MTQNIGRPRTGLQPDRIERVTQHLDAAIRELVEAGLNARDSDSAMTTVSPVPVNEGRIIPRGWY